MSCETIVLFIYIYLYIFIYIYFYILNRGFEFDRCLGILLQQCIDRVEANVLL